MDKFLVIFIIIIDNKNMNKHIIFDLDETIGYFQQFIYIVNIVEKYHSIDYNDYFELFEEYFRPHIFQLFERLISKKKTNHIKYVILYTNNNNHPFVEKVIQYIHKKLRTSLFDYIITPETKRIHKKKSYQDLTYCIPSIIDDALCFIDDKIHICMKENPNVSYIKCEKYVIELSIQEILKRLRHPNGDEIYPILKKYKYSRKILPTNVHTYSTKKMFQTIEIFIYNIPIM
jgi:hypothetical protein